MAESAAAAVKEASPSLEDPCMVRLPLLMGRTIRNAASAFGTAVAHAPR
jgi:hypothetical protein